MKYKFSGTALVMLLLSSFLISGTTVSHASYSVSDLVREDSFTLSDVNVSTDGVSMGGKDVIMPKNHVNADPEAEPFVEIVDKTGNVSFRMERTYEYFTDKTQATEANGLTGRWGDPRPPDRNNNDWIVSASANRSDVNVGFSVSYNVKPLDKPLKIFLKFDNLMSANPKVIPHIGSSLLPSSNDIEALCQGGTGQAYTGVRKDNGCELTFPASTTSFSGKMPQINAMNWHPNYAGSRHWGVLSIDDRFGVVPKYTETTGIPANEPQLHLNGDPKTGWDANGKLTHEITICVNNALKNTRRIEETGLEFIQNWTWVPVEYDIVLPGASDVDTSHINFYDTRRVNKDSEKSKTAPREATFDPNTSTLHIKDYMEWSGDWCAPIQIPFHMKDSSTRVIYPSLKNFSFTSDYFYDKNGVPYASTRPLNPADKDFGENEGPDYSTKKEWDATFTFGDIHNNNSTSNNNVIKVPLQESVNGTFHKEVFNRSYTRNINNFKAWDGLFTGDIFYTSLRSDRSNIVLKDSLWCDQYEPDVMPVLDGIVFKGDGMTLTINGGGDHEKYSLHFGKGTCAAPTDLQDKPFKGSTVVRFVPKGNYDNMKGRFDFDIPFKVVGIPEPTVWKDSWDTAFLKPSNEHSMISTSPAVVWYTSGAADYIARDGRTRPQNAGVTQTWDNRLTLAGWASPGKPYVAEPTVTITFNPYVENIVLDQRTLDNFRVVRIDPANPGPDGIVGTKDDVSGVTYVLQLKQQRYESHDSSSAFAFNKTFPIVYTTTVKWDAPAGTVKDVIKVDESEITGVNFPAISGNNVYTPNKGNNTTENVYLIDTAPTVGQGKVALNAEAVVGSTIGWDMSWGNTTRQNVGESTFVDVLPYNNDPRGTVLSHPLSKIVITHSRGDKDEVTIYTTNDDPKKIESARWIPYSGGEVEATAVKWVDSTIKADEKNTITIKASTEGTKDGDVVFNNLVNSHVEGLSKPIPATSKVETRLVRTKITGTAWYDSNRDGTLDSKEKRRFSNVPVVLLDKKTGKQIDETRTDSNGFYAFLDVPMGDYVVKAVHDIGGPVPAGSSKTTIDYNNVVLDALTRVVTQLNHGYWIDHSTVLTVEKFITKAGTSTPYPVPLYGETVRFNFKVTNNSDTHIDDIHLVDTDESGTKHTMNDITCPKKGLGPKESMVCFGEWAVL